MLITCKNSKSLVVLQLGGLNSMLSAEVSQTIPLVSKVPTMILAMGVTHAPSSRSDLPSVAAVSPIIVIVWFGKAILHSQVCCNLILISLYLCIRWSVLDSGRWFLTIEHLLVSNHQRPKLYILSLDQFQIGRTQAWSGRDSSLHLKKSFIFCLVCLD